MPLEGAVRTSTSSPTYKPITSTALPSQPSSSLDGDSSREECCCLPYIVSPLGAKMCCMCCAAPPSSGPFPSFPCSFVPVFETCIHTGQRPTDVHSLANHLSQMPQGNMLHWQGQTLQKKWMSPAGFYGCQ